MNARIDQRDKGVFHDSRYVVGWMLALRESAELAKELIAATIWNLLPRSRDRE